MKTHLVIDDFLDVDNEIYVGTLEECQNFIAEMGSMGFGYRIVPMTPDEFKINNSI